jgi:hypothetical protein
MAQVAGSDEPDWDEERPPEWRLGGTILLWVLAPTAAFASGREGGKEFHATAVVAIMPSGKTNERHVLVSKLATSVRVAVVWWHPEMGDVEACFKAFFAYQPSGFGWTLLLGQRPGVYTRRHK